MSATGAASLPLAFAALQEGRMADARRMFEALTGQGAGTAAAWLGLAHACAGLGDGEMAITAVDRALVIEPQNLRALLFKADRLAAGTPRKSLAIYDRALRVAAAAPGQLPPDVQQGLRRAQAMTEKFAAEYADFLLGALNARGYRAAEASSRFNLSLDICLGRKQVFYQKPSRYYFPGLPQRQFYDRRDFPWLAHLESATGRIRDELLSVMAGPDRFKPYLQSSPDSPAPDAASAGIMDNPDWGALYLWEYGRQITENADLFKRTVREFEIVPLPQIKGQLPIVLFSRLAARTHIPPHHGMLNTRLICHLPLVVPANCGVLRCGSEQKPWVVGETLIFDDSIEHEAWNNSNEERVVLLFDIWRPELTSDERVLVTQLLEIVRDYNDQ